MRICVDFTSAIGDRTGVGTYTREIVRAMIGLPGAPRPTLAVHVFRHPGWHAKIRAALGSSRSRYDVAPNRLLPHGLLLRSERFLPVPAAEDLFGACDVFHGTNFLLPPLRRARGVVTVHDLAFVKLADSVPVAHEYRRHIGRTLARASRVVAVSEATRRDVLELFPVPADRVVVVPEGGPVSFPRLPPEEFERRRREAGIPERYLLFVGTLEPRKNLPVLIRAWKAARTRLPAGTGLVLAGRRGWHDSEILATIREAARNAPVVRTGFVPEPLRNSLLAGALAFVFPSRYEGFGLPVLEAFRAGTPVLASRAGALPEVAGDAALYAEADDEETLTENMVRISDDENLRRSLVEAGRRRLGRFRWEDAARQTLEVYARA